MDIKVRFEKDEDGIWVATCPSFEGCLSQGKSLKEAQKNIKNALRLHIRCLLEDGLPLFVSKDVKETLVEVHL